MIRKLREADRMLGEGKTIPEIARAPEVSENTYHRWRNQFGGKKADDAKRLKEIERENARLKAIVADKEARRREPQCPYARCDRPQCGVGAGTGPWR